ncbi:MAG: DUF4326 domain-containing protein [Burkholderiales bacterium]
MPVTLNSPTRVQLSRSKGWRKPANTVTVSRPGRWGNPYRVDVYGLDLALRLHRNSLYGHWDASAVEHLDDSLWGATYALHVDFLSRLGPNPIETARSELHGRNVACWCRLDARCHGDLLLTIANR